MSQNSCFWLSFSCLKLKQKHLISLRNRSPDRSGLLRSANAGLGNLTEVLTADDWLVDLNEYVIKSKRLILFDVQMNSL